VDVSCRTIYAILPALFAAAVFGQDSGSEAARDPDIRAMDFRADPCVDFYQYACGGWLASHPIPPDRSSWGRFDEAEERNLKILRGILDKASVPTPDRDPVSQKLGDYYAACMDVDQIDKQGLAPVEFEWKRIAQIEAKPALTGELIRLQLTGVNVFFSFSSINDEKDAQRMIASVDQGGLGLPDRDYYFKTDAVSARRRASYVAHIARMFELTGESTARAEADAIAVMGVETELARGALDLVARREPEKIYHKMTVAELVSLCPAIDWPKFFAGMGAPAFETLDISEPNFFRTIESVLVQTPLEDLKAYLRWQYLHAEARYLSKAFDKENFAFFGTTLNGIAMQQSRWTRCVEDTEWALGEALGQEFVRASFGEQGRQRTLELVRQIEQTMETDLKTAEWMSPPTREQALKKLAAVRSKIGHPEKWRDYSALVVRRDDALGNFDRAAEFEIRQVAGKIGKPVDPGEWGMTPAAVNAYYDQSMNEMNFPAGILQPPFLSGQPGDPADYGALGGLIGHELTHGFDDEGRLFDAQGNRNNWWTAKDAKAFEAHAQCLVDEYSKFRMQDGMAVNGKLTLGENTADNGGMRIAWMAFLRAQDGVKADPNTRFSSAQKFFLGWGQIWCQHSTAEAERLAVDTDPHTPDPFRVNGVVSNMPEFQAAFGCRVGQPMVRHPACRVW
jgi:putative endopeptidase